MISGSKELNLAFLYMKLIVSQEEEYKFFHGDYESLGGQLVEKCHLKSTHPLVCTAQLSGLIYHVCADLQVYTTMDIFQWAKGVYGSWLGF